MAGVEPASATLAYSEFLLATAAKAGLGTVFAAGSVHAALRMAWRGTRRGRGGTVRVVGADLRRPEFSRQSHHPRSIARSITPP